MRILYIPQFMFLLILGWTSGLHAQTPANVVAAEYFIDTDPGVGQGTSIPVTPGATVNASAIVSTGGLSSGLHHVFARVRDVNGLWGIPERRLLLIRDEPDTTIAEVVTAEYFVDTDPGVGQGTSIPVTPGTTVNASAVISTGGLSSGLHHVFARVRDVNGLWGIPERLLLLIGDEPDTTESPVAELEYFINVDPGFGNGIDIPIETADTVSVDISLLIDNLAPDTTHTITVRARNADGVWGIWETRTFTVEEPPPAPAISVTPEAIYFGAVGTGMSQDETLTIGNNGNDDLEITDLSLTDGTVGFDLLIPTAPVSPGADSTVTIRFMPVQAGMAVDTLVIQHNAEGSPTLVPLSGTGIAPVIIAVDTAFGAPGDTLRVPVFLSNPNPDPVGGIQATITTGNPAAVTLIGLVDTLSNPGFSVSSSTSGGATKLITFSPTGAVIQPGTDILLFTLVYALDPSAALGSTVDLSVTGVEIGDSLGVVQPDSAVDGQLQIGLRGDLDLDGRIVVLDLIRTVRIIVGKDPAPAAGTVAFKIADMNTDGAINIVDVIVQVNTILGIASKPVASGPTAPVVLSLADAFIPVDGQPVVPVTIQTNGLIAGMQAAFTFDPALIEVGTPQLTGLAAGLTFDHHIIDGTLRVVVYGTQPGTGIGAGQGAVLHIPVTMRKGKDDASFLTLSEVLLVDPQAHPVPVVLETGTVKVSSVPSSFLLHDVRPNPFNPSTTIAYEAPQQAHITLTIYNLLGQEVARLVDQVQTPGHYRAFWYGRNARGQAVASGVYLYRLTSSTGYSESKRMTLLK